MITDEIMKELWDIKDAIALEHGYDVDRLVDYLEQARVSEKTVCPYPGNSATSSGGTA